MDFNTERRITQETGLQLKRIVNIMKEILRVWEYEKPKSESNSNVA